MAVSLQKSPKISFDIQECVTALKNDFNETSHPINDDNPLLHKFCMRLESLLIYDFKEKVSLLGVKKSFWDYFEKCLNKKTHDGIRFVKRLSEIHTSEGRGRAFIRFCLMHQCLADSFQRCTMNEKLTRDWYGEKSPLQNKEQSTFLLTVLYDLNECEFDLSPHDRELDISWPKYSRNVTGTPFSWRPPSRSASISSLASSLSLHDSLHPAESISTVPSISDSMEVAQETFDENDRLKSKLEEKEENFKELSEQYQQTQTNYAQLQEKFNDRETYLHEQIEKLKTELCASQKTIDHLSSVDAKNQTSANCEEKDRQISIQEDLKRFQAETKQLKKHLDDFKTSQFDSNSASVVQKIHELISNVHDSVSNFTELTPTNANTLADENNNLKQQVTFLQSDNLELNKKIVSLRSEFNIYKSFPQLQEQVSALKDALTTSKKLISLKDMKITKLQSDLLKHKPNAAASKQVLSEASVAQLNAAFPPPPDKNSDQYLLYEQVQDLFSCLESTEKEKAMLLSIVKLAAGIQKCLEDKVSDKDEQLFVTEKQMKEMNGKMVKMLALVDEQQKQFGMLKTNLSAAQQENKNLTKQMQTLNELLQQADKTVAEATAVDCESTSAATCSSKNGLGESDARDDDDVVGDKAEAKKAIPAEVVSRSEKADQPGIVVKVNRTLSKLHSLIEEKVELQQELESTKSMTSSLMHKVADQEHRLSTVTMELTQSHELITKMKAALSSLQTNESIMRYELKEKRHLLNKLKVQLESSRAQWKQVCKTNAESEIEWKSLREEFSQRHKQGSEESGYSDESSKVEAVIVASDAVRRDKLVETTSPTETDLSEIIVSPGDSSPLIGGGFPLEDDELDPRDRRLKFLEEQCRLLCSKLLNNSKYGAALDMRLSSLLGHQHGSVDSEDAAAAPEDQETSETSEMELTNEATTPAESAGEESHRPAPRDDVKNNDDDNGGTNNDRSPLKLCISKDSESASDDALSPDDPNAKPSAFVMAHALPKRVEKLRKDKEDLQQELGKISNSLQLAEAREVHLNAQIQLYQVEKDDTVKKLETAQQQISDLTTIDKAMGENIASKRYEEVMITKESLQSKLDNIEESLQHKSTAMVDMEKKLSTSQQELTLTRQTFEQELSSLKFQMNTQSLRHQQTVKEYEEQQADLVHTKNRINEQEKTICYLEMELTNVKDSYETEKDVLWSQLAEVKTLLEKKLEDNQTLNEQLKDKFDELSTEKEVTKQLKIELESRTTFHESSQQRMREEVQQLQSDNAELRKRIMQLLKDKDVLWKCSTQLNQMKAPSPSSPTTPDDKSDRCAKCDSEFGIFLRKHPCQICEKIFCYYCCSNSISIPSLSSDKVRLCDSCCQTTTNIESENAVVINSYINSIYASCDDDTQDEFHFATSSRNVSQISNSLPDAPSDVSSIEAEVLDVDDAEASPSESETAWKHLTLWPMEYSSSPEISQEIEITVKAGQKYGVPITIDDLNKNIIWNFKSQAKNIGFEVLYCKSLIEKHKTTEVVAPMMLCDAHLTPINGQLQPKKAGTYVLVFDNTHSRFTSKIVEVSFMTEHMMQVIDKVEEVQA